MRETDAGVLGAGSHRSLLVVGVIPAVIGGAAAIGGAAVGGAALTSAAGASAASIEDTNAMNAGLARENRAWQERMSSTAYQRSVADMRAAGLNPAVLFDGSGGSSASSPGGSFGTMQSASQAITATGTERARLAGGVAESAGKTGREIAETMLVKSSGKLIQQQASTAAALENLHDEDAEKAKADADRARAEAERTRMGTRLDKTDLPLREGRAAAEAGGADTGAPGYKPDLVDYLRALWRLMPWAK